MSEHDIFPHCGVAVTVCTEEAVVSCAVAVALKLY